MKLDVTGIEGFEEMTPEEKVKALLEMEVPEKVDLSGYVRKDLFDKTSSELAEAKKQVKVRMSAEEKAKAEQEAKWAEMEEKLRQLEKEKMESAYKASYLSLHGYTEELATETAQALAAGDIEKVFLNQQKALENYEKQLKAEILKGTPRPDGGRGETRMSKEDIMKIKDSSERQAAIAANIELFNRKE